MRAYNKYHFTARAPYLPFHSCFELVQKHSISACNILTCWFIWKMSPFVLLQISENHYILQSGKNPEKIKVTQ